MRDTDDPTRTLVLVDVAPGAPRLIGDREFYVFGASREQRGAHREVVRPAA